MICHRHLVESKSSATLTNACLLPHLLNHIEVQWGVGIVTVFSAGTRIETKSFCSSNSAGVWNSAGERSGHIPAPKQGPLLDCTT